MKMRIVIGTIFLFMIIIPMHFTRPSFNGPAPGCAGGGCHGTLEGSVTATTSGSDVIISLTGTSSDVAAELVNANGEVVAFNNSSTSNPLVLTAPAAGTYRVNAGFANPTLSWDSVMITVGPTSVDETKLNGTPETFALYNNYPNPFNPATKIKYSIPQSVFTSIKLYDVTGKEVAVLVNEMKNTGIYELNFDASEYPSGVYYYRIQAGEFTDTKKLVLLK